MPINASNVQCETNLEKTQEAVSITNLFLWSVYLLIQTSAGAHMGAGAPQFSHLTSAWGVLYNEADSTDRRW